MMKLQKGFYDCFSFRLEMIREVVKELEFLLKPAEAFLQTSEADHLIFFGKEAIVWARMIHKARDLNLTRLADWKREIFSWKAEIIEVLGGVIVATKANAANRAHRSILGSGKRSHSPAETECT